MAKTDGAVPPDKLAKVASPERVAAFRAGISAEARAAAWLMAKGYRIIAAAQAWLMAHPEHAELELRFDAVLIAPRRLPRHLLAAFDAST
jgi:putative endonuclease